MSDQTNLDPEFFEDSNPTEELRKISYQIELATDIPEPSKPLLMSLAHGVLTGNVVAVYEATADFWLTAWGVGREKIAREGNITFPLEYCIGSHVGLFFEDYPTPAEAQYAATKHLFEIAGLQNGMIVQGFGCGAGGTERAGALHYANCQFIGIDISPKQLTRGNVIAARMVEDPNIILRSNVRYVLGDAEEFNPVLGPANIVLAQEMLLHTDIPKVIENAKLTLLPGGVFAGTNPYLANVPFWGKVLMKKGFASPGFIAPEKLEELLTSGGFTDVQINELTPFMGPLMPMVQNLLNQGALDEPLNHYYGTSGTTLVKKFWGSIVKLYKGVGYLSFSARKPA